MAKIRSAPEMLSEIVIHGIREKKGKDIIRLDFRNLQGSICDFFVICHGTSTTHTEAIARSVEEEVFKATGEWPKYHEGHQNAEWILIDYIDVVVHIFLENTRQLFQLEKLWADTEITYFDEETVKLSPKSSAVKKNSGKKL